MSASVPDTVPRNALEEGVGAHRRHGSGLHARESSLPMYPPDRSVSILSQGLRPMNRHGHDRGVRQTFFFLISPIMGG